MRIPGKNSRNFANLSRFLSDGVKVSDRRRIFRGTFQSFLIQGISILLVFASNLWLVRSSDPDSYGLYVHIFNWVSILSIFVLAGRDDLVLALIPRYGTEGRPGPIVRLVISCNRWLVVATLVVCGLFLFIISLFPIRTLSEHRSLFLLSAAAVYFTACLGLNQLILQALNHIRLSQVVEKIGKPLLLILFIGLFHLASVSFDAEGLIRLTSLVLFICSVVLLILIVRKMRGLNTRPLAAEPQAIAAIEPQAIAAIEPQTIAAAGPELSRKVFYFFCISLLNLLGTRIIMLILPYFTASPKDIGIFNICNRLADLLIFPFFLMHTVLPQLFARHTTTGKEYTQSLFSESNKLMTLLSIPLLLLNIVAGRFFLHWFGTDFETGYTALLYISLAQFLFSFFGPANTILMMQDREKYSAGCLLVYVLVLVGASRLLIPMAGITGGALAILIGSLVYNLLLAVVTWRLCGIRSPFFAFLVKPRQ
jgi:O-antigen/teichoic acid export membrane protein